MASKVWRALPRSGTACRPPPPPCARGLHSTTFRLNEGALRGIGGAFRGYLGGVEVFGLI